jgi:4-methyl-5(b-hydroxyethyl)-thiazole monophosphate biosynthesis
LLTCFILARQSASFASSPFLPFSRGFTSAATARTMKVLVPIADGSEEIETTCITDTLTRFGAEVTIASVGNDLVCKMSRGIKVMADCKIEDALGKDWDLIAVPGGMPGAEHLRDCQPLVELLKKQKDSKRQYAAICAAPAVVLASNGLIPESSKSTCYPNPTFRAQLENVSEDPVVVTDNLTTSQGPGTALAFALQLGENLFGKQKRDEIAAQMLTK